MTQPSDVLVEAGRDALVRHAWQEAYDALIEADREGALTGEGLSLLASAAYWTARPDETVEALERAYGAYLNEGDQASAAMMALRVAEQHGMRMSFSQAQGWAATAERLADKHPDWPVQGWLEWMRGLMAWFQADFETAVDRYDQAIEIASRTGDRDLRGMSLHDKGHALCLLGRVKEGTALLDEAMAAVIGGELEPDAAGYVYCGMIGICSKLGDYRRAAEWTEATLRWCERQSVPAFPGVCRIHKAELLRLHGSLTLAEEEALMACEELPRFNLFSGLGPANYEIGEVRRVLGDLQGAEEAFARAYEFGFTPHPGLSLLQLAQGKVEAAISGIRQAVAEAGANHCLLVGSLQPRSRSPSPRGTWRPPLREPTGSSRSCANTTPRRSMRGPRACAARSAWRRGMQRGPSPTSEERRRVGRRWRRHWRWPRCAFCWEERIERWVMTKPRSSN